MYTVTITIIFPRKKVSLKRLKHNLTWICNLSSEKVVVKKNLIRDRQKSDYDDLRISAALLEL